MCAARFIRSFILICEDQYTVPETLLPLLLPSKRMELYNRPKIIIMLEFISSKVFLFVFVIFIYCYFHLLHGITEIVRYYCRCHQHCKKRRRAKIMYDCDFNVIRSQIGNIRVRITHNFIIVSSLIFLHQNLSAHNCK